MIWDKFLFLEQIAPSLAAHARIFAVVLYGKWRPKLPESFMLSAQNSTPLWLLEICPSISIVSCYSLSEDSAKFKYVPLQNTEKKLVLYVLI